MPAVLFTASTWSHIAHFHRPYLQAFRSLGWQVHTACGGAPIPIPESDACFDVPFEKKMTAPANFRGGLFHPPGGRLPLPASGGGERGPRIPI